MDHPTESRIDAWNTAAPNLADKPTLADGLKTVQNWGARASFPLCIKTKPLHRGKPKTDLKSATTGEHFVYHFVSINLLWLMDPPNEYCYFATLGRSSPEKLYI